MSFKVIMTTNVTRSFFTTQQQTCKNKTNSTIYKTKTKTTVYKTKTKIDCFRLRPVLS